MSKQAKSEAIKSLIQKPNIILSSKQKAFADSKKLILDKNCPVVITNNQDEKMLLSIAKVTGQKVIKLNKCEP